MGLSTHYRKELEEMGMQKRMEIALKLPIKVTRKGNLYIAACSALDVVTQGETEDQARKNIREALYLFLRSCIERGTLDAVLKECGFSPTSDPVVETDEEQINVPVYLLAQFADSRHCHA
jgi:predicted RNase H-like HicB family nuclease